MTQPTVSICIPVWNRPRMLREAMLSAMNQTYEAIEITVVDNDSTDETVEVARELARQDSRISVYVNQRNVGGLNYSRTLARSRGELVKFLNSDDLMQPHCIEVLVHALESPSVALAFCPASYIDEVGNPLPAPPHDRLLGLDHSQVFDGQDLADMMLSANANYIGIPTQALWRRSALNGAPMGFGEKTWQVLGDVALWLAILARGDASYVHEPLTVQRMHGGQHQASADFMIRAAFDWLEISNAAAKYGFLRSPSRQQGATTVALRQLAWRMDAASGQGRHLTEGVRLACERLRVQHGAPAGMGSFLGLKTYLFHETGTGASTRNVVSAFLRAFPDRTDVRMMVVTAPSSLGSVESVLSEFWNDPQSPVSLSLVEVNPIAGIIRLRGPVFLVTADASPEEFTSALPMQIDESSKPWTDPVLDARSLSEVAKVQSVRWRAAELGIPVEALFDKSSTSGLVATSLPEQP